MVKRIFLAAFVALVPSLAFGQVLHWGDFQDGDTEPFVFDFDTLDPATGEPVSPVGLTLIVRELGATTEDSDCITFNDNADGRTGNHEATVDLTDTYFQPGKRYSALITAGTAGGVDIFPRKIASWSTNQYSAAPTNFESLSVDGDGRVDVAKLAGSETPVTNLGIVFNTDFASNYNTTADKWNASVTHILGTALTDVGSGDFGSTLAGNFSVLFGQSTNESNTAIGASEINNILTRTNRIPNIAAGSSGGILIAGSNAATTFSTLTSTGAMSINGVSNVAQTGDSFARLGAPAGASHAADIADLPNVTEFNAGLAALPQTGDLATPAEINAEVEAGQVGTDTAAIVAKLPSASAKMAGEGATAKNLDQIDAGGTEPDDRDLEPVQHVWQLKRSGDGTLRSTNPLYVTTGTAQTIRAGWNCDIPTILPPGSVISAETTPVLVAASDDVTITHIGHGEKVAKVELDIASDAAAGSHWVKTTITNTNGGGPIAIYGEVVVQAEPE